MTCKTPDAPTTFSVLREGEPLQCSGALRPLPHVLPRCHSFDCEPDYLIIGGLVFMRLTVRPLARVRARVRVRARPGLGLGLELGLGLGLGLRVSSSSSGRLSVRLRRRGSALADHPYAAAYFACE